MASKIQAEKVKELLLDIMCLYRTTGPVFYHKVDMVWTELMHDYKLFVLVSGNRCNLPTEIDGVDIEYEWRDPQKSNNSNLQNTVF